MTGDLERRYRRLLRAYPSAYRSSRGDELVATYLDTADPDRRWPDLRDVADVLGGGVRQHLRARGSSGLPGGAAIAAVLALAAGAMLAVSWLVVIELAPMRATYEGSDPFAPFRSSSAYVWLAWLAAAVLFAAGSGRWCRRLLVLGLLLTVVAKPVAWLAVGDWSMYAQAAVENWGRSVLLTDPAIPSGLALAPMAALGVVALAVPSRPGRFVRWVPLVLLTPLALLAVDPVIGVMVALGRGRPWDVPFWYERATVSIGLTVVSVGVLAGACAAGGYRAVLGGRGGDSAARGAE
ncbi:hypothetical protein [Cryptosporangium phraense]|uniref:Uncharacterized protein n=1 Tax=Cryptosporangium phraense TaxID=2593070 RepID=A0A545AYV7_9ACTN|nr:hypothetical protein [Cryptosporangium phraense]TQS46519.1 hypothetical protein FL583_03810 [Cryptosporangium phraense]